MGTFLATLVIFTAAVAAMSVGVLLQGRRLRGSCGGSGLACTCNALKARSCKLASASRPASATGTSHSARRLAWSFRTVATTAATSISS